MSKVFNKRTRKRLNQHKQEILKVLASDSEREWWFASEIADASKFGLEHLYSSLNDLEDMKIVDSKWELGLNPKNKLYRYPLKRRQEFEALHPSFQR